MFAGIQRYMDEGQEGLTTAQSIEIVQKLLHQGLKRPELKDELFMQLLKQSRGNPSPQAAGVRRPSVFVQACSQAEHVPSFHSFTGWQHPGRL